MRYRLSRQYEKDGEFYEWGTYDITNETELTAMVCAVYDLAKGGAHAVRVEKADEE